MAEMNTLMGIRGRDFVLLGGDSAFFRSVVIMDAVSVANAAKDAYRSENGVIKEGLIFR